MVGRLTMLRLLLLLLLFAGTTGGSVAAQAPAAAQDPISETSAAALQARIDAVHADTALAAETKTPLLDVLGRALESARATEARQQAIARYVELRASVGERLQRRRNDLQALDGKKPGPPGSGLGLAELEQGLAAAQQAQADAQKQATDTETERARRAERRTAIPTQSAELKARLDALPTQPADAPGAEPRVANARRLNLLAERTRLQTEIDALSAELQTYDAESELLRAESDLAARRSTAAKADADAWLEVLQPMRAAAAQQAKDAAQQTVKDVSDDRLKKLAAANVAYFERFGFSFIVCATGKTAAEMLALLESRLASSRADELRTAAEEQAKISRLRLSKLVEGR